MMGWRPRYDCHCKISVLGRWRYDRYCVMDVMVKISVLERRWSANLAATPSNVLEVGISLEISGFLFKQVLFFHLGNLIFMSLTFNFKVTNQIVRNEKATRFQKTLRDKTLRFWWFVNLTNSPDLTDLTKWVQMILKKLHFQIELLEVSNKKLSKVLLKGTAMFLFLLMSFEPFSESFF